MTTTKFRSTTSQTGEEAVTAPRWLTLVRETVEPEPRSVVDSFVEELAVSYYSVLLRERFLTLWPTESISSLRGRPLARPILSMAASRLFLNWSSSDAGASERAHVFAIDPGQEVIVTRDTLTTSGREHLKRSTSLQGGREVRIPAEDDE